MARILVILIFGGLGLVMLGVGVRQYVQQRRLLRNAIAVEAVITRSEVRSSTGPDTDRRVSRNNSNNTHTAEVRFRYQVAGREYESDMIYPTMIVRGYASRDAAAEELAPFPVDARVRALVDPSRPDKAFLIARAGAGPLVFMIVGLLLQPVIWFASRLV